MFWMVVVASVANLVAEVVSMAEINSLGGTRWLNQYQLKYFLVSVATVNFGG